MLDIKQDGHKETGASNKLPHDCEKRRQRQWFVYEKKIVSFRKNFISHAQINYILVAKRYPEFCL